MKGYTLFVSSATAPILPSRVRPIEKSVFTEDYEIFLRVLRSVRQDANLSQREIASRLDHHQAFVSRSETGERRLDVIELRVLCSAMGISLLEFVERLENELASKDG